MSRYINIDDVVNAIYHHFPSVRTMADARGVIEEAPSIDIVRCKKCKWARPTKYANGRLHCSWHYRSNMPDDYCSYGEREVK